jgi:E3 ubiquitin-protein ligase DOA10
MGYQTFHETEDIEDNIDIENKEEMICRICFESYEENPNDFISPCLCNGTSKWVHAACLNEWRGTSTNPEAFDTCMTCKYTYKTESTNATTSKFGNINLFLSNTH